MSRSMLEKLMSKGRKLDREASKTLKVGDLVVYEPFTHRKRGRLEGRIVKIARSGYVTLAVPSKEFGILEDRVPARMVRQCP